MRAIVFAYHAIGHRCLEAVIDQGFEVVAVITHPDDAGESIWFPSVAELASSRGIPVHAPAEVNHPLWVERLQKLKPDVFFSFYYRHLLGPELLAIPRAGAFNLHGSLLPRYRGRCPVNWVLLHGEKETGVTLHHMVQRPDAGDLVDQEAVPIGDEDTAYSLSMKCAAAARVLLDRALPQILAGTATRTKQDETRASYFGGRKPEDGRILWDRSAREVRNLVRAVTRPWPGAFTHVGQRKCLIWSVTVEEDSTGPHEPGLILSEDPLRVACREGAVRVEYAQVPEGVYKTGAQIAAELNLVPGMRFGDKVTSKRASRRLPRVLILGVNGFIGSALGERLLESERFEVHGMDLHSTNIRHLLDRPGFTFTEGDLSIHREWIEYHVRKCDIVLPLVAIATPMEYVRNPLRVFELDFEENLKVIRYCAKYHRRIVFPSTSEVYGMCDEDTFDEDHSRLVLGPIHKQRWIYSCIKQLLDRVIWAYGAEQDLPFTIFRPFNWIGPRLDSLDAARLGSSRAITQLILNLVEGSPIQLIDGGAQKRCFTDVADGVECLFRIIEDRQGKCNGQIVNIGNPDNEVSIRELAEMLVKMFEEHSLRPLFPPFAGFRDLESKVYYGKGYEDVQHRRPSIRNGKRLVDWTPSVALEESVERTLDYFLRDVVDGEFGQTRSPSGRRRAAVAPRRLERGAGS